MTEKNKIYKLGKTLGLDKKDIDNVLSAKTKNTYETTNTPAADMYKAGTRYGTTSRQEIYKAGTDYATISHKELYKAGNLYGTLSPKELYKAGNFYGTISPNDLL